MHTSDQGINVDPYRPTLVRTRINRRLRLQPASLVADAFIVINVASIAIHGERDCASRRSRKLIMERCLWQQFRPRTPNKPRRLMNNLKMAIA